MSSKIIPKGEEKKKMMIIIIVIVIYNSLTGPSRNLNKNIKQKSTSLL